MALLAAHRRLCCWCYCLLLAALFLYSLHSTEIWRDDCERYHQEIPPEQQVPQWDEPCLHACFSILTICSYSVLKSILKCPKDSTFRFSVHRTPALMPLMAKRTPSVRFVFGSVKFSKRHRLPDFPLHCSSFQLASHLQPPTTTLPSRNFEI